MKITEVNTIAIGSMGAAPPKGVGNVLVTPTSIFYDAEHRKRSGYPPIQSLLVEVVTDEGISGVGSVEPPLDMPNTPSITI